MGLTKFIDVNVNNEGGIIKWIRGKDGTQGSFMVPPCFSFEMFLKNMHTYKTEYVECHVTDNFVKNGTVVANIVNPQNGEVMYSYKFLVKKSNEILQ